MNRTIFVIIVASISLVKSQFDENVWTTSSSTSEVYLETTSTYIEHFGGNVKERLILKNLNKPYLLRNDLIVEEEGELIIEPGVKIRFEPQVGITVRGVLRAAGLEDSRIIFTTAATTLMPVKEYPSIRLVDGPSILAGRVQIYNNDQWRSVCTNSKNWTLADMQIACRELGFQGGSFFNWFNREMPTKPRLLYEEPNCIGTESSLKECRWSSRQLGSGVCDYHPDLAIECLPRHDYPVPYWRGIRFEHAKFEKLLRLRNTMYVPTSLSQLKYVIMEYAGAGRDYATTSALHVEGVPPIMNHLEILNSAYNGINVTLPEAPVRINNCTIRHNRGYGIFINSTYGLSHIDRCVVSENGADGIRYVHNEARPKERGDLSNVQDFCTLAIASSQTFPIEIYADQSIFYGTDKYCSKVFTTRYGQVITLDFLKSETDRNNTAFIEIYDGSSINHRLLTSFPIRNNTRPQSISTTSNQIYITFKAQPRTDMVLYMRLTSGFNKAAELNVSRSYISDNSGRGIAFDNLRSLLHVHNTSISQNTHVAGLHVTSGVGDVNVTESRISFNQGDGINITYTGGNRNISKSSISSNEGYGFALWLNETLETEYHFINQSTVVQYTDIIKNFDIGILHGNFCGDSYVNISGNTFADSHDTALEILSCWQVTNMSTHVQVGHNLFTANKKIAFKISPALNLRAKFEHNWFKYGTYGALLIRNKLLEEFNLLPTEILVEQNYFIENQGYFAVNLGLSPYTERQNLLFTRNFVRFNNITEPFRPEDGSISKLNPRTRVAAPIVIGSNNINIYRNIIENPASKYEIGSHLEDQSKIINCTFNWLGSSDEGRIFNRLFDRSDRYNLAKIVFVPYLLHNSNSLTTRFNAIQLYVPRFSTTFSNVIGGEVEGEETLSQGEYLVEKDINIRPGGKLTLEPGVVLRFPPSIGIMVGGKLEARGLGPDSIKFTLKEEIVHHSDNTTYESESDTEHYEQETEIVEIEPKVPIRLLGGRVPLEGRLQVRVENEWGTVCNYGWTIKDAALVCHQLGWVLNPDDWYLERNEIPSAGTAERVILSNVRCDDFDYDFTSCKAETVLNFENACSHENDVGVRCYETSWAGIRFGALAERSNLQYITVEKSGLLDYATNYFKPAIQMDFAHHNFENIRVIDNFHDGLGIMYSDIYTSDAVNIIKNSEFSRNRGAGISFKQLGLRVHGSVIQNNFFGVRHNPALTALQQRELAGWFNTQDAELHYKPIWIPQEDDFEEIILRQGDTKYLVTTRFKSEVRRSYKIRCDPGYIIGIQLLNPIENRSTEAIFIHDTQTYNNNSAVWNLTRDLTVFPTTSTSHGIILDYTSGYFAFGGTVIVISTIPAPTQNIYNKIVKGPVPTLLMGNTKIKNNVYGVHASFYNRYLNELGDHFLRKANESLKFINCDISHNEQEAIFIHSPHWDLHKSNVSEITVMINGSLITDNGKGVYQFSRDMRFSNNLFHYVLQDVTVERNQAGGFEVNLPYVWQYNENFTHSVYMNNNTWRNNKDFGVIIDGHFALVNITKSLFTDNYCKHGLLSLKGMEKKMLVDYNKILNNNGRFMVEFSSNSQSEILGEVYAKFIYNELKQNKHLSTLRGFGVHQLYTEPTCVVGFKGIQKVRINRNLISNNNLDYQLIAGIKTAKVDNFLDVSENWWGTNEEEHIKRTIFDFDDWNNHAIAQFRPYLLDDTFDSSHSVSFETEKELNLDSLGGRLHKDLTLYQRNAPYVINADITVMPKTTLTIQSGVVMEFAPNVGILVLGTLRAEATKGYEITMKPISKVGNLESNRVLERRRREMEQFTDAQDSIRLCQGRNCFDGKQEITNQGYLEYFNKTTLQWIPMCDPRFTERNAQVVCRELGYDPLNVFFDYDIRIEFHSNSLTRIWSWPEPLQCKGTENRYEDCPIRLNGQQFGHRHECKWNNKFVFIHCGTKNLNQKIDYWGGVRFADSEFEQHFYEHRIHDVFTHDTKKPDQSILQFVNIIGAGILHNEKSPAVQSILKSPKIDYVNVSNSVSHGINLISPSNTMNLMYNTVENNMGVGINILSLTGEGRESHESSFTPLKSINLPYNLFGVIDICDTSKEIRVEERVLVYYKYDNQPVNCVKIFRSTYNVKPFGFRLLQFNLFNTTEDYGIPDFITLYDGDIWNTSSRVIGKLTMDTHNENQMFITKEPSLSIKLFAKGASSNHGFIAEIVTLPISAIGFNRDIQHNISNSVIRNNYEGGLLYTSAGEVNPIVTIERNQFKNNCEKLYGNFSTCRSGIDMDVQNTQTVIFKNNLVQNNQGGLSIRADSRGSATSLKGWIHNNLFVKNKNLPTLYIEGRKSSPYQEVTIYRNYFTRNYAKYENNIVLKQVVSNFTYNYVKRNVGLQNLEVSGFDQVRLPIYQTTTHNGFYNNYALHLDSRSTIVAGTAGQHYVDNIFFNPDNDYEIITVNRSLFNFTSTLELWKTKIDAAYNYWSVNTTLAVRSRIRDQTDDLRLLEVIDTPYYMNNKTILKGKCPPGWELVGSTCYMFIGAPMSFYEARDFCQADNASMPYLTGRVNYLELYAFLRQQQEWYRYSDRVWVQDIDRINQCTMFSYQKIEIENCQKRLSFICEIDPKVTINPLTWHGDATTIAVIASVAVALALIIILGVCWWSKSKYRHAQRLERRNSIRQSLHSVRSLGSIRGDFSDIGYRRKGTQLSNRSTDTLTKNSDYKKMESNGSIDSMEKSYNSSIEDNQSYDIYEAHNPNPSTFVYNTTIEYHKSPKKFATQPPPSEAFDLAFKNEGYRDNSTFASANNSNYQSRADSVQENSITDETPIMNPESSKSAVSYPPYDYFNSDTLPLSGKSNSTLDSSNDYKEYGGAYVASKPNLGFLAELKNKLPGGPSRSLPPPPEPPARPKLAPDYNTVGLEDPSSSYYTPERPQSANILETDLEDVEPPRPRPKTRSKSEAILETNFDYMEPEEVEPYLNQAISHSSRSKSQPLETAM